MTGKYLILSFTVFMAANIFSSCNSSVKKTDVFNKCKDSIQEFMPVVADSIRVPKSKWGKFKKEIKHQVKVSEGG